jgi:hypothetical protein
MYTFILLHRGTSHSIHVLYSYIYLFLYMFRYMSTLQKKSIGIAKVIWDFQFLMTENYISSIGWKTSTPKDNFFVKCDEKYCPTSLKEFFKSDVLEHYFQQLWYCILQMTQFYLNKFNSLIVYTPYIAALLSFKPRHKDFTVHIYQEMDSLIVFSSCYLSVFIDDEQFSSMALRKFSYLNVKHCQNFH